MSFSELAGVQRLLDFQDHPGGSQGLLGCTQFRPYGTGGAMLWILCLALCSLLTPARADPGVLVRLGMDVLSRGELVLGAGMG